MLIKPWGLNLDWQQLSYASLAVTALWIFAALRAPSAATCTAFRQSIERKDVAPATCGSTRADLQTVETLVGELADPDEQRVIYAIDMLESLDKRNLVTPLLLYHESPERAARGRCARSAPSRSDIAERWLPHISAC